MKTNFYRAFAIGLVGAFGILAGATCAIAATNIGTDITTGGNLTVSGFGHETIGNIGGIDQSIWAFGDPFETSFNNSVDINLNKNISGDLSTKDAYESLAAYPTYTHTGTNPAQITDIDAESFISAASTGPIDKQIGAFISPSNRGSGHVNRLIGVYPQAYNYGVGTVDVATAVYGNAANSGPGTITNLSGIYTFPSINYGAGTVTNGIAPGNVEIRGAALLALSR
jgi:hypothetical protein